MTEHKRDITDQPKPSDRSYGDEAYEPNRFPPPRQRRYTAVIVSVVVCFLICIPIGVGVLLLPISANKAREAAQRQRSQNNLGAIGKGIHSGAIMQVTYEFPPANGIYPKGSDKDGSFFYHMLPYIERRDVYDFDPGHEKSWLPIETYIAPADPRNSGRDATISYASNAILLGTNPPTPPRFLHACNGRTSGVIIVMERSGLDGAHMWTNANNSLGTTANTIPFPQIGVDPSAYLDGSPQGFSSAGCLVLVGDGSVHLVAKTKQAAWNWGCNPQDPAPWPPGWPE
jgi:hypothetical protein